MCECRTRLTLVEELHAQLEARLLANHGQMVPIDEGIDPSPQLLEDVRQRMRDELDREDEAS
jgi:hypothetical protein